MPDPIRVLSEADVVLLKAMANEYKKKFPHRPPKYQEDPLDQTPEVYIAKTPAGGIPALDSVGTGTDCTPTDGDIPGSAECDIYAIIDGELQPTVALSQTVYNLACVTITHSWVLITRDKYGRWIAANPTSTTTTAQFMGAALMGNLGRGFASGDIMHTQATLLSDYSTVSGWYNAGEVVDVYIDSTFFGVAFTNDIIHVRETSAAPGIWFTVGGARTVVVGAAVQDVPQSNETVGAGTLEVIPDGEPAIDAIELRVIAELAIAADERVVAIYDNGGLQPADNPCLWYTRPFFPKHFSDGSSTAPGRGGGLTSGLEVAGYSVTGQGVGKIRVFTPELLGCHLMASPLLYDHRQDMSSSCLPIDVDMFSLPGRYLKVEGTPTNDDCDNRLTLNVEDPVDWETITIVTSVSWDPETCEMSVTTREITVPKVP